MDATVQVALTIAGGGIVGGLVSAVIAPRINWGIEKKRIRQAQRQKLVESFRIFLMRCKDFTTDKTVGDILIGCPDYYRVRSYLDKDYVAEIEKLWDAEVRSTPVQSIVNRLIDDVARLETEWGLL